MTWQRDRKGQEKGGGKVLVTVRVTMSYSHAAVVDPFVVDLWEGQGYDGFGEEFVVGQRGGESKRNLEGEEERKDESCGDIGWEFHVGWSLLLKTDTVMSLADDSMMLEEVE